MTRRTGFLRKLRHIFRGEISTKSETVLINILNELDYTETRIKVARGVLHWGLPLQDKEMC